MKIPNGCDIMGTSFLHCPIDTEGVVSVPDGVTRIESGAFKWCASITEVRLPDSLVGIGGSAFMGCKSLVDVDIPRSVRHIQGSAFAGCTSLLAVNIPECITEIGSWAFFECDALRVVAVPDTCHPGMSAFPKTCEVISPDAYRRRVATRIAGAREGEGVDAVGMHHPTLVGAAASGGARREDHLYGNS